MLFQVVANAIGYTEIQTGILVQFSSVQDCIYSLGNDNMRSTPSLVGFPNVAVGTVTVFVWLMMTLSSFQKRSSSASSFHASLLQATDGILSLVLYPQVLSQVPQHFRSSETQAIYEGCFARQSIISSFHFLEQAIWICEDDGMCGHSDCHLLRQSSGGHGWLLPPLLSSWSLRPYSLYCLHGR